MNRTTQFTGALARGQTREPDSAEYQHYLAAAGVEPEWGWETEAVRRDDAPEFSVAQGGRNTLSRRGERIRRRLDARRKDGQFDWERW